YYHRNGFDKLVLLQGQTYKLRLHHFRPNGGELPSENIHDHRWPFASAVISGRLHMNLFETHPTLGQPVQEYQYTSNRTDETLRAVPVGANRLRTCDYLVYEAGTQYFMPTTALHQIVYVPGQQALTLVLTGKPERSTCRLFAKEVLEPEDMDEILYTGAFLRKKLLVLAKHIQTLS
ncbi:MAG TPA: hypothetical protein PKD90_19075, partial [Phnomibacter sp.]|nr:hypothetical protein [Phnomibacter sp.]